MAAVLTMSRVDRKPLTYALADVMKVVPASVDGVVVALLPVHGGPTAATVWTSVTYAAGSFDVLLVGPDADSTGALVVPGDAELWAKVTDAPLVEAVKVERIVMLGGAAALAAPVGVPVVSVNGKLGSAVVLSAADVGAPTTADLTNGLATKVNSSTYTAGLAGKQDTATLGATVVADATVRAANDARYGKLGASGGPRRRRPVKMVQTMQTGHGWTKFSAAGTMVDDTTVKVLGTQSLKLSTDGTTNTTIGRKTSIGPFDFTGKSVLVWVRASAWANLTEFSLYLSSDNLAASWYTWNYDTPGALRTWALDGEWVGLTLPWKTTGTGTPNRAAINAVQVRLKSSGPIVDGWFGGLAMTNEPASGVVSVVFDDGKNDQYTAALPIMSKYGIPATSYVICDVIGDLTKEQLTLAQLRELETLHAWEVAVHAGTNAAHDAKYTNLTEAEIAADFTYARQWMLENGFTSGVDHLAYPGGGYDDKTLRQAHRFFTTARTIAEQNHETYAPADPYRLRVYELLNTRSAATVTAEIDKCIAAKSWLILVLHRIVAPGTDDVSTEFPTDDLETVMAYLASTGVACRTIGDVARNGV